MEKENSKEKKTGCHGSPLGPHRSHLLPQVMAGISKRGVALLVQEHTTGMAPSLSAPDLRLLGTMSCVQGLSAALTRTSAGEEQETSKTIRMNRMACDY